MQPNSLSFILLYSHTYNGDFFRLGPSPDPQRFPLHVFSLHYPRTPHQLINSPLSSWTATRKGGVACARPNRLAAVSLAARVATDNDVTFSLLKEMIRPTHDRTIYMMGCSTACDNEPIYSRFQLVSPPSPPVGIHYSHLSHLLRLEAAIEIVLHLHVTKKTGDILMFLPTNEEVEQAVKEISRRIRERKEMCPLVCLTLHSDDSFDNLKRIESTSSSIGRRVVVSSLLGETDFVFDASSFHVDDGFHHHKIDHPR